MSVTKWLHRERLQNFRRRKSDHYCNFNSRTIFRTQLHLPFTRMYDKQTGRLSPLLLLNHVYLVCPKIYERIDIDELVNEILSEPLPASIEIPQAAAASDSSTRPLRILHLTDIHMDPGYVENMPTTCNYPVCCRDNQPYNKTMLGSSSSASNSMSGYWGTLGNCDLPERTFDAFVEYVKNNLADDIDLVIWTGDNVSHDQS